MESRQNPFFGASSVLPPLSPPIKCLPGKTLDWALKRGETIYYHYVHSVQIDCFSHSAGIYSLEVGNQPPPFFEPEATYIGCRWLWPLPQVVGKASINQPGGRCPPMVADTQAEPQNKANRSIAIGRSYWDSLGMVTAQWQALLPAAASMPSLAAPEIV